MMWARVFGFVGVVQQEGVTWPAPTPTIRFLSVSNENTAKKKKTTKENTSGSFQPKRGKAAAEEKAEAAGGRRGKKGKKGRR